MKAGIHMELVHGGDLYSATQMQEGKIYDFSANINPLGMPAAVRAAAEQAIRESDHYPDPLCRTLRAGLSELEQIPAEWILCGNGAADLIFRIAFALRPQKALITAPAFYEYEQAMSACGCDVAYFPLDENKNFVLPSTMIESLHEGLDCIFLCNPNNPTGAEISHELLHQIAERCRELQIYLILDECFIDFLNNPKDATLKPELQANPQVFILRAFTKLFAIPGLRLGYGLCSNTDLLEKMAVCGQPWSVSVPAQSAGLAALRETDFDKRTRSMIAEEREFLTQGLLAMGFRVYPSAANYLLFRARQKIPLKERLLSEGFLIRSCANYRGLDERYYRIAVRCREENRLLLAAIGRVLSQLRRCIITKGAD